MGSTPNNVEFYDGIVKANPIVIYGSDGKIISSFGGGTQYTDGQAPPANPIAGALLYDKAGVWTDVSVADPLPVSATVINANANGQALMINSQPTVPASDYISPVKSSRLEIAGTAAASVTSTSTDLIPSTDTTGYTVAVLQLTGTWTMTLQAQQCNDNATFLQTEAMNAQLFLANTGLKASFTGNGMYIIPLSGRYLRIRPSAWTSNASCVGTLELYTTPPPFVLAAMATYLSLVAQTSGGTSLFHLISAATTNATNVKASAGQVYGWDISNTNAAWRYVKMHNNAGTPTAGAGVVKTIGVPPGGKSSYHSTLGIPFGTGIAISTTTGIADADVAAVGASDLAIDIDYF